MKCYSNPSRLFFVGAMLLTAEVWGSESEDSQTVTHLRRNKHRKALEVDENMHDTKPSQIQQFISGQAPAKDQTGFSPRNQYGYGYGYGYGSGNVGYYQNMQPPLLPPPPPPGYYTGSYSGYYPPYTKMPPATPAPSVGVPTISPTFNPTSSPTFTPTIITEDPTFTPTIITEEPSATPTAATPSPTLGPDTVIFSLQDTAGVCNGAGIGCSSDPGDSPAGNPNDIVNCFNAADFGVSVPFSLTAVRVWIGDSPVLTPDLQVNVWMGFSDGSGPDRLLYSEEQFGYTFGENNFQLRMARMIMSANFCVGVTARSTNAGLRIATDDGGTGDSSFLRSPACGVNEFLSLLDLFQNSPDGFCIEAVVRRENFR